MPPSNSIFISYRRSDSNDITGRIYDFLSAHFGHDLVFKDVDSIPAGRDFRIYLNQTIGQCQVVVAVIGATWLEALQQRLEKTDIDWVRSEISIALERGIPVIPLLVGGAGVPRAEDLPKDLEKLAYYNARQARPDPDFKVDMLRLIGDLDKIVNLSKSPNLSRPNKFSKPTHMSRRAFHNRQNLLAQVKNEVEGRLTQSLCSTVLINLCKEKQPQQVERPWDLDIKVNNQTATLISSEAKIITIFDQEDVSGKLLILGEVGSGKTTTLIELARELITRAESDVDQPMPVLFVLSSWKYDQQTIAQWLVSELKEKYGVRWDIGEQWLMEHQLLPLLDGLDELEAGYQEKCVDAINIFLASENRALQFVVCSRLEEYERLNIKFRLNEAICLKPITEQQIQQFLEGVGLEETRQIIRSEPKILQLAKSPLFLSFIAFTYRKILIKRCHIFNSTEESLKYLLKTYVQHMLSRKVRTQWYSKRKPPKARETQYWLHWLAQRLKETSQAEFLIEKMQPSWLKTNTQKCRYRVLGSLVGIIIGGFTFGLISWLTFANLLGAIASFLIGGAMVGPNIGFSKEIKTLENLTISWTNLRINFLPRLSIGLFVGVFLGGTAGLIAQQISTGIFIGLVASLSAGLINILHGGLTELEIDWKKIPNQGIYRSARNAGIGMLIGGLILGLTYGLASESIFKANQMLLGKLTPWLIGVLIGGLSGFLICGGLACLQHLVLRFTLWLDGEIPWNYSHFLNYTTDRMFLQRIGGRYRFNHELIKEYFASLTSVDML